MAEFIGNCVGLDGESIQDMVDEGEETTYRDFLESVPERELKNCFPSYDWHGGGDLELKDDWAVSFNRSEYNGRKCMYVSHSSIEYVWVI